MARQFDRIIYSHPAGEDGFEYFYIAYQPGGRKLSLKYRRPSEEAHHSTMSPEHLLEFLRASCQHPSDQWPFSVVDRAARLLRNQIVRWENENGVPY